MTDKCVTVQIDQLTNTETEDVVESGETQAAMTPSVLPTDIPPCSASDSEAKESVIQTLGKNVSQCWPGLEDECNARTDSCQIESEKTADMKSEETVSDVQGSETSSDVAQGCERSVENEETGDPSESQREEEIK